MQRPVYRRDRAACRDLNIQHQSLIYSCVRYNTDKKSQNHAVHQQTLHISILHYVKYTCASDQSGSRAHACGLTTFCIMMRAFHLFTCIWCIRQRWWFVFFFSNMYLCLFHFSKKICLPLYIFIALPPSSPSRCCWSISVNLQILKIACYRILLSFTMAILSLCLSFSLARARVFSSADDFVLHNHERQLIWFQVSSNIIYALLLAKWCNLD